MPFLIRLMLIADPVVKEITLPVHTLKPCSASLPIANHCRHARILRKAKQCMQMIRHE